MTLKSIPNKIEKNSENKEGQREENEKEEEKEVVKEKIEEIKEEKMEERATEIKEKLNEIEEQKKEKEPEEGKSQEKDEEQKEKLNELTEEKKENEPEDISENSLNDFLMKNDSLIKVINITLESKGFSRSNIISKVEEFFKTITQIKLDPSNMEQISNLFIQLLSTTLESDKKDLDQFFKELFSILKYDKEKILEQILKFSDDIEEQEKLKTRKLNRTIRSHIKECQNKFNQIFKQDDMPSDKVVGFDKFNQIAEEVGLDLKKEYMDVLLYQMKMAVPKGRSIHNFNMIVIVDFLK